MTTQQTTANEAKLKDLQEENELLLLQLHQVQEELVPYFLVSQSARRAEEPTSGPVTFAAWMSEDLPELHAEIERLRILSEVQKRCFELESQKNLNVQLGNILIDAADKPGGIFGVPGKLIDAWRQSREQIPPELLGGKDFVKVKAAYDEGGFKGVGVLLGSVPIAQTMCANAFTALARHLMKRDAKAAAQAARLAYESDPRHFRLKWLAFRLHEAGEMLEADAILELLPAGTIFSESERRQVNQLRQEAKDWRLSEARSRTSYTERRREAERKLRELAEARDEQKRLVQQKDEEMAALKVAKSLLEKEKVSLVAERGALQAQQKVKATEYANSLEQEKAVQEMARQVLERQLQEKEDLAKDQFIKADKLVNEKNEENQLLLFNLHQAQEELVQLFLKQQEAQKNLDMRGMEIEVLKQGKATLEQEKDALLKVQQALENKLQEQFRLGNEKSIEANTLVREKDEENQLLLLSMHLVQEEFEQVFIKQDCLQLDLENYKQEFFLISQHAAQLEREKLGLNQVRDEQAGAIEQLGSDLLLLKLEKAQLEEEKNALIDTRDEQAGAIEQLGSDLLLLKLEKAQLEEEKNALIDTRDEQAGAIEQLGSDLLLLKLEKAQLEEEKNALIDTRDEQTGAIEQLGSDLLLLKLEKAQLEQKHSEVMASQEKLAEQANELGRSNAQYLDKIESLKQDKLKLDKDSVILIADRDLHMARADQLFQEKEQVRLRNLQLEEESLNLIATRDDLALLNNKLLEESKRNNESYEKQTQELISLKKNKEQLERDMQMLASSLEDKVEHSKKLSAQIENLEQTNSRQESEQLGILKKIEEYRELIDFQNSQITNINGELSKLKEREDDYFRRTQLLKEELAWAEAQLDLIKSLVISDGIDYEVG